MLTAALRLTVRHRSTDSIADSMLGVCGHLFTTQTTGQRRIMEAVFARAKTA